MCQSLGRRHSCRRGSLHWYDDGLRACMRRSEATVYGLTVKGNAMQQQKTGLVVSEEIRLQRQTVDMADAVRSAVATFTCDDQLKRSIEVRTEPAWVYVY